VSSATGCVCENFFLNPGDRLEWVLADAAGCGSDGPLDWYEDSVAGVWLEANRTTWRWCRLDLSLMSDRSEMTWEDDTHRSGGVFEANDNLDEEEMLRRVRRRLEHLENWDCIHRVGRVADTPFDLVDAIRALDYLPKSVEKMFAGCSHHGSRSAAAEEPA
jgi:hypothetical protein